jgi:hypothetical protein
LQRFGETGLCHCRSFVPPWLSYSQPLLTSPKIEIDIQEKTVNTQVERLENYLRLTDARSRACLASAGNPVHFRDHIIAAPLKKSAGWPEKIVLQYFRDHMIAAPLNFNGR